MGTLNTMGQKVSWEVGQTFSSMLSSAKDKFNAAVGGLSAAIGGILNGDVVGINEAAIPGMQASIREYVEALDKHLAEIKTNADTSQAFKGEYAAAVTDYVTAVCDACGCIISELLVFNKKLSDVYDAYVAKDTEMASDIKGQAGELNSEFKRYTEN